MKYMIMLFGDDSWAGKPPEWVKERQMFMGKMDQELRESGEHVDGQALAGAATTVRFRDGAPVATDGPFAESKEALAGYWIVDVESEARALEIASEAVAFTERPLEVRAVMDASGEM